MVIIIITVYCFFKLLNDTRFKCGDKDTQCPVYLKTAPFYLVIMAASVSRGTDLICDRDRDLGLQLQEILGPGGRLVNKAANTLRPHWKLTKNGFDFTKRAKGWIRAAGLKQKDIKPEDVARCVCAGVGVLAKERNPMEWVFKRTMLRLERELRTWNNKAASDPNTLEMLQHILRRGGILTHPQVYAALIKEARWDKKETTTK
jgi:hypothetical protein